MSFFVDALLSDTVSRIEIDMLFYLKIYVILLDKIITTTKSPPSCVLRVQENIGFDFFGHNCSDTNLAVVDNNILNSYDWISR